MGYSVETGDDECGYRIVVGSTEGLYGDVVSVGSDIVRLGEESDKRVSGEVK